MRIIIWLILLLILAAGGLSLYYTQPKKETSIRIGYSPWPGYEYLYLADKKGFFKEAGLSVRLIRFNALEDTERAFERGQIDVMAGTPIEIMQAQAHGAPAIPIMVTDFSNGADFIIARKGIDTIAKLKGKTIAAEASFGAFVIASALQRAGLTLDDVHLKNMNQMNIQAALLAGRVDAVHTYAPFSTELLAHTDKVVKLFDSAQIPGEILSFISVKPALATSSQNQVRALQAVWEQTLAYANTHPGEADPLMAEMEGTSVAEFEESLRAVKVLTPEEQRHLIESGQIERSFTETNAILLKFGQIDRSLPVSDILTYLKSTVEP